MNFLRKLAPAPLFSAALLLLWLALARSASAGQVLLGIILALAVPIATERLGLKIAGARRPLAAVRFIFIVIRDVVASNLEVARDVLLWRWRRPHGRFVIVPLDLRDPTGLAALAMVTTVVPGTVWSEISLDRSKLMLHVWNAPDEAAFIAFYKARYEKPLREIFE